MSQKKYVQFSKRIVVAVTAAVTVICAAALVLCFMAGDTGSVVAAANAYIGYATVAFVAYSGNSAAEKWLVHRYGRSENETSLVTGEEVSNG